MQVPAPFTYRRASTLDDAISLLRQHDGNARLIAGGHSLLPLMKLRLAAPDVLIDINDLTDLGGIRLDGGELRIGAMVRHADLEASPLITEHYRILADAERVIADPVVRNRGTVGGSLCHADPAEDLSVAFAAIGADVVIRGPSGERVLPVRELATGPFETVLEPDEVLTEVRMPIRTGCGSAYVKVERRAGDYAIAAAGAVAVVRDGAIADVGLGLCAVGAAHSVAVRAEQAVRGRAADEQAIELAASTAAEECDPVTDQRGPADYKRALAGELIRRALRSAIARSQGQADGQSQGPLQGPLQGPSHGQEA